MWLLQAGARCVCPWVSEDTPTLEHALAWTCCLSCYPKGHGKKEGSLGPRSSTACHCPHSLCRPPPSTVTPGGSVQRTPLAPQWMWRPSCLPSLSTGHLRRGRARGVREPGGWSLGKGQRRGSLCPQTSVLRSPSPPSLLPPHRALGKESPRTNGSVVRNLCP